jgi:uridine kinase
VIALKRPTGNTCAAGDGMQFQQVGVTDQVAPLTTAPPPPAFVYVDGHAVSGRRIRRRNRHPTAEVPPQQGLTPHQPMQRPRAFASSSDGRRGRWPDRLIRSSTDAFQRRHHRSCSGIRKRPWWSLYLVACWPLAWPVMRERPFILAIAGGTGSGKTTVAQRLANALDPSHFALVKLDSYYRDRTDLTLAERAEINYDHPDSFDWQLLRDHLRSLLDGQPVDIPVYDFADFNRSTEVTRTEPAQVVCVEGILVLYEAELRSLFDLRVYVDTDADVRLIRRLRRDVAERGRTPESVIDQYLATVRPSHEQFVEPSKRFAHVIIPEGGRNDAAFDMLVARLKEFA